MPDELWTEVRDIVQKTGIKTIPMEKKCKKAKWLSGEDLQIAVKRREVKSKGKKERYKHLSAEFQLRRQWHPTPVLLPGKSHGWRFVTLYRKQGSRTSPWKRNAKKQNGCLRKPYK